MLSGDGDDGSNSGRENGHHALSQGRGVGRLRAACADHAAAALAASERALQPVQAFGAWGASYEGVHRRLTAQGRQLRRANDQLVRAYGPAVGSGAEHVEKVEHFSGPLPSFGVGGGGGAGNDASSAGSADGPAALARFQTPRQPIELQGRPHQVLRAVLRPPPGSAAAANPAFVNVNRNLVVTVQQTGGGDCKRGARIVLSEGIPTAAGAAPWQAWHFQHASWATSSDRTTTGGLGGPVGAREASVVVPQANAALVLGALAPSGSGAAAKAADAAQAAGALSSLSSLSSALDLQAAFAACGAPLELCNPVLCNPLAAAATAEASQLSETGDWSAWVVTEDGDLAPVAGGGFVVVGLAEFPPGAAAAGSGGGDKDGSIALAPWASSLSSSSALLPRGALSAQPAVPDLEDEGSPGGGDDSRSSSGSSGAGAWGAAATTAGRSLQGAALALVPRESPAALKFTASNGDPRRGLLLVADAGNAAVRVVAPRDGRVQTLVGGRGPAPPVDGPLRLFAPRNAGAGLKARKGGGSSGSARGAAAAGDGSKVASETEERDEADGGPLWKRGDVVEGRDWRRGGRWQRAVLVAVHGAAFGDGGARGTAAAPAGKAAAGKAAAGNKPASQKAAAGSQAGTAGAAASYEIQAPGLLKESVGQVQPAQLDILVCLALSHWRFLCACIFS